MEGVGIMMMDISIQDDQGSKRYKLSAELSQCTVFQVIAHGTRNEQENNAGA